MACVDTRQLTQANRVAGFEALRNAGVVQAVRPFSGQPTPESLADYINRELFPAVKRTRERVNDVYRPVTDNAPSANPLTYFFSDETANADPTAGRIRFNAATQNASTILRVSQQNVRLIDVAVWLDIMNGSATLPLGTLTLVHLNDPTRFIRFDLNTMTDVGAYWNLGVTELESSHPSPFLDGDPITLSFIPGVAGAGALLRYFPGQPIYDVMAPPYNAVGDGIADDTAALNAAHAAANLRPGRIYLGERHRITAALTPITNNNIVVQGRGEFNGGSRIIVDSAAAIDVYTFSGGQYCGLNDVWIVGVRVYTSGWGVVIDGTLKTRLERVIISELCFGVHIANSTLTYIDKTTIVNNFGVFAFVADATLGNFNHSVTFRTCVVGTSYPNAIVGNPTAWQTSTAYVVGNVVTANSAIYQCVTGGTSAGAGTGPSGIPSSVPATAHTTPINDGSVQWVFAMPAFVGFLQGSWAQTFECIDCGVLQGLYGFSMEDTAPAVGSEPIFARFRNFQADHCLSRGIRLSAGGSARFESSLVISVIAGSGIEITSGFDGNWEFIGGEVFGCLEAGMIIGRGDGLISGMQIGACGGVAANTRDCIEVAAGVTRFRVADCSGGAMFSAASPSTRYGLSIGAGCDNYTVVGNTFIGNLTGGILNTPGRSSTRVLLNNVPDVTITAGSFWGLQVDATSPAVPLEITGVEAQENLRRDTIQTVSGVSGTLDIQLNDDTTVLLIRTTADATLRTLESSTLHDGGREVIIEHDRLSGAGTLTIAHNTAGLYATFFNPDTSNIVLGQTTCLEVRLRGGFWRPQGAAQARITDRDYGDITVTGGGLTWTVDNDVVTNAKLANMAAGRVKGVQIDGSTGDPQDLTGAEVLELARRDTIQTVSGVSGTLDIQLNDDTTVLLIRTTADATLRTLESSTIADGGREVIIEHDRQSGSGNLTIAHNTAGLYSTFFNPDTSAIVLGQTTCLEVRLRAGFWRPQGTAQARLTDRDYGDITVSGGGLTWTIDNDVVSDAKLRNSAALSVIGRSANSTGDPADITAGTDGHVLRRSGTTLGFGTVANAGLADMAQSRIKGRAEGAGTGPPTDLTPTEVASIIDGETITWSAGHTFSSSATIETLHLTGRVAFDSVLAVATTGGIDNLSTSNDNIIRFTGTGGTVLSGMSTDTDNRFVLLVNATSGSTDDLDILLESTSSSAANRFAGLGTSRRVKPGEMAIAWYDTTSSRWRLLCRDDADL